MPKTNGKSGINFEADIYAKSIEVLSVVYERAEYGIKSVAMLMSENIIYVRERFALRVSV